jgi:hypothetical protein
MNKLIFFCLLLSTSLYAQEPIVLTTQAPEAPKKFNPYKGHGIVSFGFEGMKYDTQYDFKGEKSSFSPQSRELWGGRVGFGAESYLGAGLNSVTKVEAYYMGTLFSRVLNGGDYDEDVKFAYTKRTGQIFGAEVSQAFGRLFDMKTKNPVLDEWTYLTVEPFIEGGIGLAKAYNRLNYQYDLGTVDEAYRLRVKDELINARVGVGVNLTSSGGYFLYLKSTYNRYDVVSRKADGFAKPNGGVVTQLDGSDIDKEIDAIVVYAIGGGYKF